MRGKRTVRWISRLLLLPVCAILGAEPPARLVVHEHEGGSAAHLHFGGVGSSGLRVRGHDEQFLPFARNDDSVEDWLGAETNKATRAPNIPAVAGLLPVGAAAHAHVVPFGPLASLRRLDVCDAVSVVRVNPLWALTGHAERPVVPRCSRAPPLLLSLLPLT